MSYWDDELDAWDRESAIAVGIVILVMVGGIAATLFGAPLMLALPLAAYFGVLGLLHWLLVVRLPERKLGFWTGFWIDTALGVWLLITYMALCRHGAWDWLGHVAARLGRPGEAGHIKADAVFVAIACGFFGLQLVRLGEDAPWGEALTRRISPTVLHFGIKMAMIGALLGFLAIGGEAMVQRWLSP